HCDPKEVDAYTSYAKLFKQLALDVGSQPVETAVSAHYRQGGVRVNPATMESTVPGLFVAGGLGGHCNGLIALVTYDGKVVADSVAGNLAAFREPELPEQQGEEERDLRETLLGTGSQETPCAPGDVKEAVRALMWEKAGIEK